jgi:CheY-like chemotaxis protein
MVEMADIDAELKAHLLQMKAVSRDQVVRIETDAAKRRVSFRAAILDSGVVKTADIGSCLSQIYKMPYLPISDDLPPSHVREMISTQAMKHWKIFPADYDTDQHVLTFAVHDPAQIQRIEHIFELLIQPYTLAFVIASDSEIDKAIEAHITAATAPTEPTAAAKPAEPTPKAEAPKKVLKMSALRESESKPEAGTDVKAQSESPPPLAAGRRDRDPQFTREEMSRVLTSSAALLAATCLESKPDQLAGVRERVRYGQLLAVRLGLQPIEVDKVAIASWLAGIDDRPHIIKQFVTPYGIDRILFSTEKPSAESLIMSLVRSYHDMKKRDPAACKDVNLTRRNLRMVWSAPQEHQGMLEVFLQLLMDEEFLANIGRAAGRILIVDPMEMTSACVAPPLTNDGYEVHVVATSEAAQEFIGRQRPDLIIAEVDLPNENGLTFCHRVKHSSATAKIPFLAMMSQRMEKSASECLRAGADDYMIKPVNLELLFLKIQKLTVGPHSLSVTAGVRGSLEDMSFTDMIQIVCAGNKSLEIVITGEGHQGHVFVQNGEIIHAQMGDKQAEDAFYRLMQWHKGEFSTKQCVEFPARTIKLSTMSLLMEGARLADEGLIK